MRILKITTAYEIYLEKFRAKHPGHEALPYAEQKRRFDHDAFGLADFWSHALAPLGYEVFEVTANHRSMQATWASEHGVALDPKEWLYQIPRAQALAFQPDILYMDDYSVFSRAWIEELRQACPSIRWVVCWCSSPYQDADIFHAHDLVLSCIPELSERFRELGHRSEHLNQAFEPRVLERIDTARSPHLGFTFVGQVARGSGHGKREQLVRGLAEACDIQIYAPAGDVTLPDELYWRARLALYHGMQGLKAAGIPPALLARIPNLGRAAKWQGPPGRVSIPDLKRHLHPSVFGLDMFQTLHDSVATFNCHIDLSPRSASNMRLFEATGVGTCLVTDWKENLADLYEPDREVVTYRSLAEAVEKVQWLLDHPVERAAIARAAQARTLRDHTFERRAQEFDAIVRRLVAGTPGKVGEA